jgi:hypothetical protein
LAGDGDEGISVVGPALELIGEDGKRLAGDGDEGISVVGSALELIGEDGKRLAGDGGEGSSVVGSALELIRESRRKYTAMHFYGGAIVEPPSVFGGYEHNRGASAGGESVAVIKSACIFCREK